MAAIKSAARQRRVEVVFRSIQPPTTSPKSIPSTAQPRAPKKARSPEEELLASLYRQQERTAQRIRCLEGLLDERTRLSEQVGNMRELAERAMTQVDERERDVEELEAALRTRDGRIQALETQNQSTLARLAQLESTLQMLAEADEKLETRAKRA